MWETQLLKTVRETTRAILIAVVFVLKWNVDCITLREERRIEEATAAYKPIQSVIDVQVKAEMVSVVARLSPVLTFKA